MSASQFHIWLRCGALLLCSPVFVGPSEAAGPLPGADAVNAPSHVVKEGNSKRPLWIDSGRVADFGEAGRSGPLIRPAEAEGESDSSRSGKSDAGTAGGAAAEVSPLFVDAAGQLRALPGGVIVTLKQALPEGSARAQLEAAGLVPRHPIGERMWLVDSPVGIESLELAERLNADGGFESAEPNWWRPRRTK